MGLDVKNPEHLVKHLSMLPGDADRYVKLLIPLLQALNQRCHLDSFGPSAKNEHYFLSHIAIILIKVQNYTKNLNVKSEHIKM